MWLRTWIGYMYNYTCIISGFKRQRLVISKLQPGAHTQQMMNPNGRLRWQFCSGMASKHIHVKRVKGSNILASSDPMSYRWVLLHFHFPFATTLRPFPRPDHKDEVSPLPTGRRSKRAARRSQRSAQCVVVDSWMVCPLIIRL